MAEPELLDVLAPLLADRGDGLLAGDDAAVLQVGDRTVCLTVDVLVEGVHFRRDLSALEDVGWRAVAVGCSDVAALGGRPRVALVGLSRPVDIDDEQVEQLYAGMREACDEWRLRLAGGDTVDAQALALSVTVLGDLGEAGGVRRDGARPGDRLVLVGALGAASAALRQMTARVEPDPRLLGAQRRPRALVAAGQALAAHGARALLGVSDGLAAGLARICTASGVGAVVRWEALPVADGVAEAVDDLVAVVCAGGQDYALLAALPAERAEEAAAAAGRADGVPAAVIGEVVDSPLEPVLRFADGRERPLGGLGHDHAG